MADTNNHEAGKAPVKETSDFAQSTTTKDTTPKPETKRPAEGRTPQAGR